MPRVGFGFVEVRHDRMNAQKVLRPVEFEHGFKTVRRSALRWVVTGCERTEAVRAWCADQFGPEDDAWTYFDDTFWFRSGAHAMVFKLRWV